MARRYYIIDQGERIYRDTQEAIRRAAKTLANATGAAVRVYEDTAGVGFGGTHKSTVSRGGSVAFTRNPMMQGHDYTTEKWKVTGKNPRTGSFIHAYADNKAEAQAETRVLRGAGYTGVMAVKVGAKKLPASKMAAMQGFKRNPTKTKQYYVIWDDNFGKPQALRYTSKMVAERAAQKYRDMDYDADVVTKLPPGYKADRI